MFELRPGSFTLCMLALLVAASAYGQTIWVVDPDGHASASSCADSTPAMTTIGAAISAAGAGDTILVCPGTYVENINFGGKGITVQSVAGPAVTVIDGNFAGSVVTFATGETAASVLQGFTIRNGQASFVALGGGGVHIDGASPVIRGNVITGNRACEAMGIYVSFASPLIEDNTIENNIQYGCTGGTIGGGILIGGTSSAVLRHNKIYNNLGVMTGGGIGLNAAGSPTIELNLISGNSAQQGGGIGLGNSSNPTIAGNVIVGNQADQGGGIYWLVPSGSRGPLVINNTIAGNKSASGSGIYADGFDVNTPVFNNVIVASGSQTALYCGNFTINQPIVQYNDVFSAGGAAYGGICGDLTGVNGNISADPRFVNPVTGDYRLLAGSAAIDAGSNTAAGLPSTDFDGHARVIDGNADGFAVVDMGAYETSGAGAAPGTFAKLAPTNTATGQALVVTLTWQPSAGATAYEVCYDTVNNGTCDGTWIPAWNDTSVTVPALDGGATYYWQVRARNEGGVTYADGSSAAFSSFATAVPSLRRTIGLTGNLAFGGVMAGTSATRTLTISNSGNGTLTVTGILCPPGFTANYAGGIPPGGSQAVTVTFSPAAAMSYSGTLLVVADETDGTATAPLSGWDLTAFVVSNLLWQNDASRQVTDWQIGTKQGVPTLFGWNWLTTSDLPGWTLVGSADFNGDGVGDLIWQNDVTRQVTVWYMGGVQHNVLMGWTWLSLAGVSGWKVVAARDVDGDGHPDLIWQNDATRQVTVWYMGGAEGATFQGWTWLSIDGVPGWSLVATGDFNGDGHADLVWQNDTTRQVTVWYFGGAGGATFQGWNWISIDGVPGWTVVGARDFDGDGHPDLVWQNDTTRQVTVWFLGGAQGTTLLSWNFLSSNGVPGWTANGR